MLRVLRILRILDSMNQLLQPRMNELDNNDLYELFEAIAVPNEGIAVPNEGITNVPRFQMETIELATEEQEQEQNSGFGIQTWYMSRTPDGPDGINQHIYYNILGDQDQNNLYYVTINEQPRQKLYNIVVRKSGEEGEAKKDNDEDCCPICYELMSFEKTVRLNCSHVFCGTCIESCLTKSVGNKPLCAICRTEMKTFSVNSQDQDLYETLNKYCKRTCE
jgi:hypothetical protein